uniref:Uncharacterized protein n=1 Tax=Cacopsylla melanoneura TaxID=428564 RepID=A0A8D8QJ08_9HEMI
MTSGYYSITLYIPKYHYTYFLHSWIFQTFLVRLGFELVISIQLSMLLTTITTDVSVKLTTIKRMNYYFCIQNDLKWSIQSYTVNEGVCYSCVAINHVFYHFQSSPCSQYQFFTTPHSSS